MPAKLPEHLIEQPEEYLKDMPVGASWYVGSMEMRVDPELNCYLNPMAKRREKPLLSIKVRRDADGFHVTIEEPRLRYTPGMFEITADMIPVASVTQDYERQKKKR